MNSDVEFLLLSSELNACQWQTTISIPFIYLMNDLVSNLLITQGQMGLEGNVSINLTFFLFLLRIFCFPQYPISTLSHQIVFYMKKFTNRNDKFYDCCTHEI